jgi:oligosaccharide repeat unit polymerase
VYSRLFFDVIGYSSFLTIRFPVGYTFSKDVGLVFIIISFLSFYIVDIIHSYRFHPGTNILKSCPQIRYWGLILFFVALIPFSYKIYLTVSLIRAKGYMALYDGSLDDLVLPFWTAGAGTFFVTGFVLFICSYPSRKQFVGISVVFVLAMFFNSLKGTRGLFLVNLLAVIYCYFKLYQRKVHIKQLSIILIVCLAFTIWLGYARDDKKIKNNIRDLIFAVFYEQGSSIANPLIIIEDDENMKDYHPYPFILQPIVVHFHRILGIKELNMMGSVTIRAKSLAIYKNGNGLGGNGLAEMYDCGGFIGIIIWSIILAILIRSSENRFLHKNINIAIYWFIVCSIIYLPRNVFFDFISGIRYWIIMIFFIGFLNFIFYPRKINHFV